MPDITQTIALTINGISIRVTEGTTVAAAVAQAGITTWRRSVSGEVRAPLCGMGICFECRLRIDGQAQLRSCQTYCRPGMDVRTDE